MGDLITKSAWLHNLDTASKREFRFLAYALREAWEQKATGYIVTPSGEVINIRKGKRLSVDGKKWIPCSRGL